MLAFTLYQKTLTGEAKQVYQVWRDALAPVYFKGRRSRGEPFLTGDKSGVIKFCWFADQWMPEQKHFASWC